jgi:PAS domain S-box-containing protein
MRTSPKALSRVACLYFLAVSFAVLSFHPGQSFADDEPKRVLILFGDDINHPAMSTINQSLRSSFARYSTRVELYPEYLDRRLQFREYENEFLSLMHRKYDGRKLDLIIAVGRPALELLLPHGSKLFPKVPNVFITLDKSDLDGLDVRPDVTGVWTEVNIKANLELALELYPETKKVIVVGGISPFDNHWMDRAHKDFKPYEEKIEFQYLVGLTVPEQQQTLSNLSADSVIIFISNYLDHAGNYYMGAEVLSTIAPAANRPIIVQGEIQLGSGAVGGRLISENAMGTELARISSRIMAGEKPQNIAPHAVPLVPMFDSRALKRWGTSESKLPADSIILNREPTLWQLYRGYIITIIVAASLETLLIIFLIIANAKRKHVIVALRQSDERFEKAFQANPQPMSLTIRDTGRYLDVNESFLATSGYSREEVIGHTSLGLGIWETPEIRKEFINLLDKAGSVSNFENKLRTKSGRFRILLSSAEKIELSGEECVLIASSDITERKQAEDAVLQAKDELRLIADSLPVLVSQIDANAHYTFNNLTYETWFDQPRKQITGRHMRDLLGESVWRKIRPHVKRVLEGHDVFYEDQLTYGSGPPRWVKVSLIPVKDQNGKITGAVSLVSDITESRRAERILRDLTSRLIKAQEEERSRVARELHDDLSQKVALLSIELDYAERHIAKKDDLTPAIQKARTTAEDISEDIHRISHQLHPSRLDHLGLVKAVKAYLQEISILHDLEIDFRSEGFPSNLPKDETLCVFRIIQESLRNVIKHSGAHKAEIVLERLPTELRVTVTDHGCGFDTNSEKLTSGLGLIGMTERLRLVGGQIAIWSAPQKGTRIEVRVPLSNSKSQSELEEIPQPTLTVSASPDESPYVSPGGLI